MKKAKARFVEYTQNKFQAVCNRLLDLTLDEIDYPDYDPAKAEQLTRRLLAQGRLAIATEDMKGLCV